jgi:hypothetical protein
MRSVHCALCALSDPCFLNNVVTNLTDLPVGRQGITMATTSVNKRLVN